jgi:hypothetical protein
MTLEELHVYQMAMDIGERVWTEEEEVIGHQSLEDEPSVAARSSPMTNDQ